MNAFVREFTSAAKQGPRLYFEPLVALMRFIHTVHDVWKNRHHEQTQVVH
jgi:hypothetical protein